MGEFAVNFAALYKKDPEILVGVKNDIYQPDDLRYLACQYHQLFEADPQLVEHVPALDVLRQQHAEEVAGTMERNPALMAAAERHVLPGSIAQNAWESLAPHARSVNASVDGVSDDAKDWLKAHHEVTEELEKQMASATG